MEENEKNYLDWEGLLEYHEKLNAELNKKANTEDLADVATSGNYNDLENTPTNVSLFNNDAGYITSEIDNTNGHDYVEIGGIKWATMNIGAENITDIGLYFQWGDILGYTSEEVGVNKNFTWEDYKFNPSGDGITFIKYNSTDLKTSLDIEDDAAANAWGSDWRVPTTSELQTLSNAVNVSWTNDYEDSGVPGLILTDKEDSSKVLFLPVTGVCNDGSIIDDDTTGFYWSKSLGNTDDKGFGLGFDETNGATWNYSNSRSLGFAIRPVLEGPAKRTIMGVTQLEKDKWNSKVSGIKIGESGEVISPVNGVVIIPNQSNVQADWNQNDSSADDFIKNKPGMGVANGLATLDSSGKVPSSQLPLCIYIGSCGTEADVLNKEIITSNADFTLSVGCIIGVKYTNTNTASATSENKITLNVNSTGAKHIYYNNQVDPEGTLPTVYGEANKYIYYMYDGTYWVWKGIDYVIDTKNTTGASATLNKIYIVGAESQQAEAQTYSQSTAYIGTDGCLYSDGQKVLTSHQDISGKADVSDLQDLETAIKYNNVLGTTISSSERTAWNAKVDGSSVGAANGVASLDANGKVPSTQLPSYVDDVIEAASFALLPEEGEAGKIYVTLDDNKTYRWGGSAYVLISESLAIGTTAGTACEGNDPRLSDSRPASDVYAWAKAATKPTYTLSEVGSISSVVQVDSNLNNQVAPESVTGSGNSGKMAHILYVNNGGADYTIVVSTASGYITPDGTGVTLTCPQNGYCELSYLNINGTIYVRGL